jgi:GAF domain-containing protein
MDELERSLAALSVGTSEYADDDLPASLSHVLRSLRERFGMDVVFVAKIADGQRTFMAVDSAPGRDIVRPGMSDPVEQSWCHNIVQGRLPELIRDGKKLVESGHAPYTPLEIGTHLSVPVVLPDGSVYGTLCTFAFHVDQKVSAADVERLREAARTIGTRLS